MSDPVGVLWSGREFISYDPKTTLGSALAGVYIFAGTSPDGRWWQAKYVGQTRSFAERLPNHERWEEAEQLGATHIHALVVSNKLERQTLEYLLIQNYSPALNA